MTEKQITDSSKEFTKLSLCTTVFAVLMTVLIVIKTLNLVDISWWFVFLMPMCANLCWVVFSNALTCVTMLGWMIIQVNFVGPKNIK